MQKLIPIVIFAFIAGASALNLAPATVTAAVVRDFEYHMSHTDNVNSLIQKLVGIEGPLGFYDKNYINQIAGEIFLYAEIMDANPYHSLKWQFRVSTSLGVLKVIDIAAKARPDANGRILLLVGKAFEVHQTIPQVYSQQQVCHQEGHKFLFFGHKRTVCETIQVPRSLNADEINQINQALTNKIPDALKQISQNF